MMSATLWWTATFSVHPVKLGAGHDERAVGQPYTQEPTGVGCLIQVPSQHVRPGRPAPAVCGRPSGAGLVSPHSGSCEIMYTAAEIDTMTGRRGSPRAHRAWPWPGPRRQADLDNARRSGPEAVTFRTAIGVLAASVTAWPCSCGAASGRYGRDRLRPVPGLPPRNGETPATLTRLSSVPGRSALPRLLAPARVAGSGRRHGAPKVRP
jgi:hypothetical protein